MTLRRLIIFTLMLLKSSLLYAFGDLQNHDKKTLIQEEIKKILDAADKDLKAYRLTTPKEKNAFNKYQKVLELEPQNKVAQKGLQRIVYRYIRLAKKSIEKKHFKKAEGFLNKALSIGVNKKSVQKTLKEYYYIQSGSPKEGDIWTNPLTQNKYVWINDNCFQMGSPDTDQLSDGDERQHEVCINGYWIAKYEVTIRDFQRFVNAIQYQTFSERSEKCWSYDHEGLWGLHKKLDWRKPGFAQTLDDPVVCISYYDAQSYISWLKKETKQRFRLPTEAEWEYAARGKNETIRYWGNDIENVCQYANIYDISSHKVNNFPWSNQNCNDRNEYTSKVGQFYPNNFGLFDMMGNVWEWTCSAWKPKYDGSEKHCLPNRSDKERITRGGGWNNVGRLIRSAIRMHDAKSGRNNTMGFRLVRD